MLGRYPELVQPLAAPRRSWFQVEGCWLVVLVEEPDQLSEKDQERAPVWGSG